MEKMTPIQRRAVCNDISDTCRSLLDIVGSLPLAETIRILQELYPDVNRGMAADGLTLAINRLSIRTIRMPNGEWSVCRRKVTS